MNFLPEFHWVLSDLPHPPQWPHFVECYLRVDADMCYVCWCPEDAPSHGSIFPSDHGFRWFISGTEPQRAGSAAPLKAAFSSGPWKALLLSKLVHTCSILEQFSSSSPPLFIIKQYYAAKCFGKESRIKIISGLGHSLRWLWSSPKFSGIPELLQEGQRRSDKEEAECRWVELGTRDSHDLFVSSLPSSQHQQLDLTPASIPSFFLSMTQGII